MKAHLYSCDEPAKPCICGAPEEPRIIVIARSSEQKQWEGALGREIVFAPVGRPLYGMRADLIIVDLPPEDLYSSRTAEYLDYIQCRLSPTGKLVYVK
jgi:hypothetical protein